MVGKIWYERSMRRDQELIADGKTADLEEHRTCRRPARERIEKTCSAHDLAPYDEHTRECSGGLVERSITADDLIDELCRMAAKRGCPVALRCDNGPELACAAMADWARDRVGLAFIPPGQRWRNGYIESFNSRVRDECLNISIFWSLAHARVVIGDWKYQYNHHRPHSALGLQTPARYAASCGRR
jgi:putative transposase